MGSLPIGGRALVIVGLALLVVLGVLWLWLDPTGGALGHPDTGGRPPSTSAESTASSWQTKTVRRGLEERGDPVARDLSPLAITQSPPRSMPRAMREKVLETLGPGNHLGLDLARAWLTRTKIGVGIWVVEGRGVTCAFRDGVGSSICQTSVQARRHGLLLETYKVGKDPAAPPTHFTAFGIAPDRAHFAVVKIEGHRRRIPIVDHAYALRGHEPIEVLRLVR
jgi:hypothetical protein